MDTQILRDPSGREVGRVTHLNKVFVLRSPTGRELGRFDPATNMTKDATGRVVGRGNLLAFLVGLTV